MRYTFDLIGPRGGLIMSGNLLSEAAASEAAEEERRSQWLSGYDAADLSIHVYPEDWGSWVASQAGHDAGDAPNDRFRARPDGYGDRRLVRA